MTDLDTLRRKYPHLAWAVYAFDPGGPVTLECITADGKTFPFVAPTLAAAIALGFPEDVEPKEPAAPGTSVFD
jgi:hypothetical protein